MNYLHSIGAHGSDMFEECKGPYWPIGATIKIMDTRDIIWMDIKLNKAIRLGTILGALRGPLVLTRPFVAGALFHRLVDDGIPAT